MSEIRQDPTTGEWVIIAGDRRKRPSDFIHQESRPERPVFVSSCPFCPGNENMTPPAVLSYRDENTGAWRLRVIVNKFPAVTPEGSPLEKISNGYFLSMDGLGYHEVIIDTPVHNACLALMNESELTDLVRAYRQRYEAMSRIPFVKYIILFKNWGIKAGTSLEHPHSQIIATAIIPGHIRVQYDLAANYYSDNGRCLYADLMKHELETGARIVLETDRFLIFHPFASHRPFETWIMPKASHASFGWISDEDIQYLAKVLKITLLKLYHGLNNPDFNLVIDSAPVGEENANIYRWHVRIIPRITEIAGFEVGSGIFINTALPEETARFVRDIKV